MYERLKVRFHGCWWELLCAETTNSWVQLFRYGLVGGGAFLIDFAAYCILERFGLHYLAAGVLSFAVSFCFNFTASRALVFAVKGKTASGELSAVLAISLVGLLLTELLLYLIVSTLRFGSWQSKILASALVLLWNYFARKHFIYKRL